jgi:hypothetical protein
LTTSKKALLLLLDDPLRVLRAIRFGKFKHLIPGDLNILHAKFIVSQNYSDKFTS